MGLLTMVLLVCAHASFCDGREDGVFCDGAIQTRCRNGDVSHTVVCAQGCDENTTAKATCSGTSSCLYGYPGSFCQLLVNADGAYEHRLHVCHRSGQQQQFSCRNECRQLTDSFAYCIPDSKCAEVDSSTAWFGFCPTPTHPIHRDEQSNFALYDALARELTLELESKSPLCPFTAYLAACEIVHTECKQQYAFSRRCESSCLLACHNYAQCSEFSGVASPLNCNAICGAVSTLAVLLLLLLGLLL